MTVFRIVAFDELVQVFTLQRICLESEVYVCPEIIDPELLCPGCFRGRLFVEEKDICLYSLGIEKTGRQSQECMHIAFMEELAPDCLACAAFKEDVIRHNDCRTAMLFEKSLYMLDKIKLFVRGRCPEVLTLDRLFLLVRLPVSADYGCTALFAEGRIGQHHLEPVSRISCQRI